MSKTSPTTEAHLREQLAKEGLTVDDRWSNGPRATYAIHEHPYAKVLLVVSGSITFTLHGDERTVSLQAGHRLDVPAGTPHSAVVGADGVLCLEAHLPVG